MLCNATYKDDIVTYTVVAISEWCHFISYPEVLCSCDKSQSVLGKAHKWEVTNMHLLYHANEEYAQNFGKPQAARPP